MTMTDAETAAYHRADAMRAQREAAIEADAERRRAAETDARQAAAEAAAVVRRTQGIPERTFAEVRAELDQVQAEDDEFAAAEATIARITRRRAARRRAAEQEVSALAVAEVAAQTASRSALRTYPMQVAGMGGVSFADGLVAQLRSNVGPLGPIAEAVQAALPAGRVDRAAVLEVLAAAGLDPETGTDAGTWW